MNAHVPSLQHTKSLYNLALAGWLSRHRDFDPVVLFAIMTPPPGVLITFALTVATSEAYTDKAMGFDGKSTGDALTVDMRKLVAVDKHDDFFDDLFALGPDGRGTSDDTTGETSFPQ